MRASSSGELAERLWNYIEQQNRVGVKPTWKVCRDLLGCHNSTIKRLIDTGYLKNTVGMEAGDRRRMVRRARLETVRPYTRRFKEDLTYE